MKHPALLYINDPPVESVLSQNIPFLSNLLFYAVDIRPSADGSYLNYAVRMAKPTSRQLNPSEVDMNTSRGVRGAPWCLVRGYGGGGEMPRCCAGPQKKGGGASAKSFRPDKHFLPK